jgi:hypothetical protein
MLQLSMNFCSSNRPQQNNIMAITDIKLVKPRAADKHELSFNKLTSER